LIALISQCPDPPNRGITGIGKTSCKDLPLHPIAGKA